MERVGSLKIVKLALVFAFAAVITGCSFNSVNINDSDYDLNETVATKKYSNINKDRLLHGVKKLLLLSFEDEVIIDSHYMEVNATRPKMITELTGITIENDNFYFKVSNDENQSLRAQLSISTTTGIKETETTYFTQENGVYDVFWSRLDYILGISDDYDMCGFSFFKTQACTIFNPNNIFLDEEDRI